MWRLLSVVASVLVAVPVWSQSIEFNQPNAAGSLGQLFNQSIWWDFIRGNGGQNLRLLPIQNSETSEILAIFEVQRQATVEPVVRLLTFEQTDTFQFDRLYTAEPIPGRIVDVQLRNDLTDHAEPTLVLLTERGGVALLRSLVVMRYTEAQMTPLLSISDLGNATVQIRPGAILITTAAQSGVGRAVLYQWRDNQFQTTEL